MEISRGSTAHSHGSWRALPRGWLFTSGEGSSPGVASSPRRAAPCAPPLRPRETPHRLPDRPGRGALMNRRRRHLPWIRTLVVLLALASGARAGAAPRVEATLD